MLEFAHRDRIEKCNVEIQKIWINTAHILKGSQRRLFIASVIKALGRGGASFAEKHLGWNRGTIRKGIAELSQGTQPDRFHLRGRKRAEFYLPDLLKDIRSIVDSSSQADPTFRSTRIYTPLTAEEVKRRLQSDFKYKKADLPTARTLRSKLNGLGFCLRKVRKCKPLKKLPETDAIFNQVAQVNIRAKSDNCVLRISLDTKATIKVGKYSRGGYSRHKQGAYDHDFKPDTTLTPFGILLPEHGESHLWFSQGKITADFMVDRIEQMMVKWIERFNLHTLIINADNGPECSGRRTQWLKRLVSLSDKYQIRIELAYYPPYHSKYNPVERLWGVLENHWRGEILETVEKSLGLARSMRYRGIKPTVSLVRKAYQGGIRVAKCAMAAIEKRLVRMKGLEPWFITIHPALTTG